MDVVALILQLVIAASFSWVRMFIALFASILIGLGVGIYIGISSRGEKFLLPVIDILQTLPILAFFPFVILIVVGAIPGYIGINAAVIFLIITSMLWNIILGVYESVKTIPKSILEVGQIYGLKPIDRLFKIFIPASMPRVVEQSILSWSVGLFFLVTSEIFSTGSAHYAVKNGIGVMFVSLASAGGVPYLIGILVFIAFVVATRFLFFKPLENRVKRYTRLAQPTKGGGAPQIYRRIVRTWATMIPRGGIGRGIKSGGAMVAEKLAEVQTIAHRTHPLARFKIGKVGGYVLLALLMVGLVVLFGYKLGVGAGEELQVVTALAFSFARIWIAYLLILLVSVPLCVYLVFFSKRRSSYILLFQIIASIPATILLPLIVKSFSGSPESGELVAFSIFFLSGIWYLIFSILSNASAISPEIEEVKKIFNIKGWSAWKNIYIKALIPGIITGSITGIAAEWNASIVAEYFTSTGISGTNLLTSVNIGIGKLLDTALSSNNIVLLALAIINLTVMIILINTFVWKRFYNKVAAVYR